MGPAVLITVGVLFLLEQLHVMSFGRSFPILLIVIGVVKIAQRSAPETGHVQPALYYPPGDLAEKIRDNVRRTTEEHIARTVNIPPAPPTIQGNPPDSEVKRG
jgi:hypothetical protein